MRDWDPEQLAVLTGAELLHAGSGQGDPRGPGSIVIDSRRTTPGALFIGLPGSREDGGAHAPAALGAGAWGVIVRPEQALALAKEAAGAAWAAGVAGAAGASRGAVLSHPDPLLALQIMARVWREQLQAAGARVVGVTGSTGKTSTKDILAALLAPFGALAASPENLNTEIGLPLAILAAPPGTRTLVLEMAMRGPGQIAELTELADPDVGVIVNVGPAHLELLGSLEGIAAAKAELIAGLRPGAAAVLPAGEALLEPYLRPDLRTITFGPTGQVRLLERRANGTVVIADGEREIVLAPSFGQAHQLGNLLAAVAVAGALGHTPSGALEVSFSAMRGQRSELGEGMTMIDDCYNANPMSMRAAINELTGTAAGRTVAVLGDMLELGTEGPALHREIGEHAHRQGVELLVAVGPLAESIAAGFAGESRTVPDAEAAAELVPGLLRAGDTVLLKGSRGVGLESVAQALRAGVPMSGAGPGQR
jgi:UDP-N-acetylmuramoyl-tripeptide--D-alanyl-D-alanine ligase